MITKDYWRAVAVAPMLDAPGTYHVLETVVLGGRQWYRMRTGHKCRACRHMHGRGRRRRPGAYSWAIHRVGTSGCTICGNPYNCLDVRARRLVGASWVPNRPPRTFGEPVAGRWVGGHWEEDTRIMNGRPASTTIVVCP